MKRVTRTALATQPPTLLDRAKESIAASDRLDAKQKDHLSSVLWQPLTRTSGWWVGLVYVMISGSVVVHHEPDGRTTRIPIKL